MAAYERFVRTTVTPAERQEVQQVSEIASRMLDHLEARQAEIDRVHVHGAPSKAVQDIVAELLVDELGFEQEYVLTPEDGLVTWPGLISMGRFLQAGESWLRSSAEAPQRIITT